MKARYLGEIIKSGVVGVIRANSAEELMNITLALSKGGVKALEITMTSPGALETIKAVTSELGDGAIIGVGSVLDSETARAAILAGAQFVVSPVFKPEIVELCRRYDKISFQAPLLQLKSSPLGKRSGCGRSSHNQAGPWLYQGPQGTLATIGVTPTGGVNLENTADFVRREPSLWEWGSHGG